jgi:hypothetical protein
LQESRGFVEAWGRGAAGGHSGKRTKEVNVALIMYAATSSACVKPLARSAYVGQKEVPFIEVSFIEGCPIATAIHFTILTFNDSHINIF